MYTKIMLGLMSLAASLYSAAASHPPIIQAAIAGDLQNIQALIQSGESPETSDSKGISALHHAAENGHLPIVKYFLKDLKMNPNIFNQHKFTPMHISIIKGHAHVTACLIKYGSSVNMGSNSDHTPLHTASRYNRLDAVRLLVEHGADLHVLNVDGLMPFHRAAAYGSREVLTYFVKEKNMDPDMRTGDGQTALLLAYEHNQVPTIELLLSLGATPHIGSSNLSYEQAAYLLRTTVPSAAKKRGGTGLHVACATGQIETIELLLNHGASPEAKDYWHETPFNLACKNNRMQVVELFIRHGADPNKFLRLACRQDTSALLQTLIRCEADINIPFKDYGMIMTFLYDVCARGDIEKAQLLLDAGAPVNAAGYYAQTPLFAACKSGNTHLVALLLSRGAEPNIIAGGTTPLIIAAFGGHIDIVRTLVEAGSIDNCYPKIDVSALQAASIKGHLAIVQFLHARGSDVNAKGMFSRTPLLHACAEGHIDVAEFLLTHGARTADTAYYDYESRMTALACAAKNGHTEIVGMLLAYGAQPDGKALKFACEKGHLTILQMLVRRLLPLPKSFKIEDTYPDDIKAYLNTVLHPEPIGPDDYRYERLKPVAASSSCLHAMRARRKFKTE